MLGLQCMTVYTTSSTVILKFWKNMLLARFLLRELCPPSNNSVEIRSCFFFQKINRGGEIQDRKFNSISLTPIHVLHILKGKKLYVSPFKHTRKVFIILVTCIAIPTGPIRRPNSRPLRSPSFLNS